MAILGVRLGPEVGVPAPVNTFIYHSLLSQKMKAMGPGSLEKLLTL